MRRSQCFVAACLRALIARADHPLTELDDVPLQGPRQEVRDGVGAGLAAVLLDGIVGIAFKHDPRVSTVVCRDCFVTHPMPSGE